MTKPHSCTDKVYSTFEATKEIQELIKTARVEAIASYKKVNDKLENQIRIDELENVTHNNRMFYKGIHVVPVSSLEDRLKSLELELNNVKEN